MLVQPDKLAVRKLERKDRGFWTKWLSDKNGPFVL
jgi:hypothetical protein